MPKDWLLYPKTGWATMLTGLAMLNIFIAILFFVVNGLTIITFVNIGVAVWCTWISIAADA